MPRRLLGRRPSGTPRPDDAGRGLTADTIVVGAGASGRALTAALAEDPDHRVLVVEEGRWTLNPMVGVPKGFVRTMGDPRLSRDYAAVPRTAPGSAETWKRGVGVGGSTLINGTMYLRGDPHLYERLAAQPPASRSRGTVPWGWRC